MYKDIKDITINRHYKHFGRYISILTIYFLFSFKLIDELIF